MINEMTGDSMDSRIVNKVTTTLDTFQEGSGNFRPDHSAGEVKSDESRNHMK
jgi:hypothetical protein